MSNNFSFTDTELLTDKRLIVAVFENAEKEILKEIEGKNLWRDADRRQMLARIKRILIELEKESGKVSTPIIEDYYNKSKDKVDEIVGKSGVFQTIDTASIEFVVASLPEIQGNYTAGIKNLLSGAYSQIETTLNLVKKELRQELITQIATSKIKGESKTKLAKKLIERLTDDKITGFTIPSTKTKSGTYNLSVQAYVDGLVQQTLITSSQSATTKRALELGQDLLRISTHSNPSSMCEKWAGQIVSISGKSKKYPSLKKASFNGNYKRGGIGHKYCRHITMVYIETNVSFNTYSVLPTDFYAKKKEKLKK